MGLMLWTLSGFGEDQSRRASWRSLGQERESCRTSVLGNYVSGRTGARLGMALRCARQGGKPQGHLPSGPISHHALLSCIASTEESIAMLQKIVPSILLEPLRAVPILRRLEQMHELMHTSVQVSSPSHPYWVLQYGPQAQTPPSHPLVLTLSPRRIPNNHYHADSSTRFLSSYSVLGPKLRYLYIIYYLQQAWEIGFINYSHIREGRLRLREV